MAYKSILVSMNIDDPVEPLIRAAVDLARRLDSRLIGFAAAEVTPPISTPEGMIFDGKLMQQERVEIEKRLAKLQLMFTMLCGPALNSEWRQTIGEPTRYLLEYARSADLVLVAPKKEETAIANPYRSVNIGSLVLYAGRPVMVLADETERIATGRALVAWKNTREARRAVADAVPLLAIAKEVVLVAVENDDGTANGTGITDVAAFLSSHGIKSGMEIITEPSEAGALVAYAKSTGADILVSGAYGHSRIREWVFGGVTRTLLAEHTLNRFMSN